MAPDREDVDRIIDDLRFLKGAITRNNNILRFMALSRILGTVCLVGGLLITVFASAYFLLIQHYGSYAGIPAHIRTLMAALIVIIFALFAVYKVRRILAGARRIRADFTLSRLTREVYTSRFVLVFTPFLLASAGIVSFLVIRGLPIYIVPALAILFGLLCNSLIDLFYVKELVVGGDWLIATGLLALFLAESMHPLPVLILTFGLGLIVIYLASLIMTGAEGKNSHG